MKGDIEQLEAMAVAMIPGHKPGAPPVFVHDEAARELFARIAAALRAVREAPVATARYDADEDCLVVRFHSSKLAGQRVRLVIDTGGG